MTEKQYHHRIPQTLKTIHLIAVCGTAMGALACMLKDMGFEVTGSDQNIYPPMSSFLASKGIEVMSGFDPTHLAHRPDLVIVGNAVTRMNPEAQEMLRLGLHFCSMPEAVNHFMVNGRQTILITGTHGKTTTSAIIAWMLEFAGLNPSLMIGGILKNFNSNFKLGNGRFVVLEGDEYDTAFFDKGPKFLHYDPYIAILTSVEFDHADIYRDLDHVRSAFDRLIARIRTENTLVAYQDDPNVSGLISDRKCRVVRYGTRAQWALGTVTIDPPLTCFEVIKEDKLFGTFRTTQIGRHNLTNMLAAIATADHLRIPSDVIGKAIKTFEGVKRRQEVRGQKNGITIIDDFAHHPTAVKETIQAVKPFYKNGRIIAVFEPRSNTSMRNVFQNVYPLAFDEADMICIRTPSRLDKVPEPERFSSERLVEDLVQRGKDAYHFSDTDSILIFLKERAKPGDGILIMSNGGFDQIHDNLLEIL